MIYFKKYLQVAPFSLALWRCLEAEAISKVKIKSPILDIGCGFGEFAGVFFDRLVEVGVDINADDLILAAEKKKYRQLILADAKNLPFKNNTFNTVLSVSTLEHIRNVDRVLSETFRVLKPKGTLVFTVPTTTLNGLLLLPPLKFIWLRLFHWSFKHQIITPKEKWMEMVQEAGFKIQNTHGTISKNQVRLFELGLPFALPTQLFRLIFKKRLPFSPKLRVEILEKIFHQVLKDPKLTDANIIIVAQKPS